MYMQHTADVEADVAASYLLFLTLEYLEGPNGNAQKKKMNSSFTNDTD